MAPNAQGRTICLGCESFDRSSRFRVRDSWVNSYCASRGHAPTSQIMVIKDSDCAPLLHGDEWMMVSEILRDCIRSSRDTFRPIAPYKNYIPRRLTFHE